MGDHLKIGVLAEKRYLAQSQPSGMLTALRKAGHDIVLIDPEASLFTMGDDSWLEGLDLIVGRGRSWGLLCLLGWAEDRGVTTINRRDAIAAVHNKANMAVALAGSDLPTPQTYLGATSELAREVAIDHYPLILKPIFGDNCRGLQVVRTPDEMATVDWPEPVALAQSYHQTDGYDLKLYGIGDKVWAILKPSPFNPRRADEESRAGELELTPELEALGRRCGEIFGLELYGVDCILSAAGPLVIEINDFPNYTSVPEADDRLADYVATRAREERAR
ncbi:MAG: ATP-grasp domain-containing protein [Acidobacteriota bacterium]